MSTNSTRHQYQQSHSFTSRECFLSISRGCHKSTACLPTVHSISTNKYTPSISKRVLTKKRRAATSRRHEYQQHTASALASTLHQSQRECSNINNLATSPQHAYEQHPASVPTSTQHHSNRLFEQAKQGLPQVHSMGINSTQHQLSSSLLFLSGHVTFCSNGICGFKHLTFSVRRSYPF